MGYRIETIIDDAEWDAFVRSSPQGSPFVESRYLSALGLDCDRVAVSSATGARLAVAAVPLDDSRPHQGAYPFCPYQGVLLSSSVSSLPPHKRHAATLGIVQTLIEALCARHRRFSLALSPAFEDLRPFLWHNYHQSDAPRFSVTPRYTAVLDLRGFHPDAFFASIRASRRQEFRKSAACIAESDDVAGFSAIYRLTFERQGISVPERQVTMLAQLADRAIKRGFGWLSAARLPDGRVASMALFINGRRHAYYLAAANHPDMRHSGSSTHLLIDNIAQAARRGCESFDFVGVNSPNRGDFKLSFNPALVPYAELSLAGADRE